MDDVLVTGVAGRVGTAVTDYLDGEYSFTALDRKPVSDIESVTADITDSNAIEPAFDDIDSVVHLAGEPSTDASWDSVLQNNIIGMYNCLEAARKAEVESFVFASSNHVVGMYEAEFAPDLYEPGFGLVVDHTAPPRPDSFYGTSKLFGEAMGRQYVETFEYPKRFYSLRIGSVRSPSYDHPFGDAERGADDGRFARDSAEYNATATRMMATWHSRRDLAHLVDRCLRDNSVEFDIFYGVSDNPTRWFDLEHARATIGYRPKDSAADWSAPPEQE